MADLANAAGNDLDLLFDTDARHWAERFASKFLVSSRSDVRLVDAEGLMLTWFAGAIEAGRAAGRAEARKPPPHGVGSWARPTGPGAWEASCLCGQDWSNIFAHGANEALQYHLTDKLAGHGPKAPRHTVKAWASSWRDDRDWHALCSCGADVKATTRADADQALLSHFENTNTLVER